MFIKFYSCLSLIFKQCWRCFGCWSNDTKTHLKSKRKLLQPGVFIFAIPPSKRLEIVQKICLPYSRTNNTLTLTIIITFIQLDLVITNRLDLSNLFVITKVWHNWEDYWTSNQSLRTKSVGLYNINFNITNLGIFGFHYHF